MKAKTFEGRMAFFILISVMVTGATEYLTFHLIRVVSEYLRENGYRSSAIGPDGVDPGTRIGMMIFVGILVFVITFSLQLHFYIRYLRMITAGIQRIADGNFDVEIPVRGQDEFARMARNLNRMQENVKVIMEKERIAEHANHDLISSVAHDLRTPLTSILGYLGWVREREDLDEETKRQYIDIAYEKAKRLQKLTEELFGFVKLRHKELTLHLGQLDLVQMMKQLLDEISPSLAQNHLKGEFICRESTIPFYGDGNLLARLFDNLLSNAVKYGKEGKLVRVQMELDRENEQVITRVINFGKVIPREELAHIFQKFYRIDQSRTEGAGGTGLGLPIVEQITHLHDGQVSVKSDLNGTVFTVVLPVRAREEAEGGKK